jgi:FecR protein
MDNKKRSYYVDWWKIKKSSVYSAVAIILFLAVISGGVWWMIKSDWLFSKAENADIPKDSARLISFEGDVRVIRAATRETILVTKTTYLMAGDTIQTQSDGKAQIKMIDGSTLSIRPNSTVVIRDSASLFGGTNVRVSLGDGQINVKTQDQGENTQNVVELKESENRLSSQTDASFNTNDKTNGGEIRISRGSVESNTGSETTIVKENEFASVNNGKVVSKEKLLAPPTLILPSQSAQINASENGNADVTFQWQKPEGNSGMTFQMQIAKSPFFVPDAMLLMRESLSRSDFSLANLTPGTYYWRLRLNTSSGQTSEWGEPWKFTVIKKVGNTTLTASDWDVENLGGNLYLISGKTRSGATVRIFEREVFAMGDGSFRLQVSAPSGEATAEISDENGNKTRYVLSLKTGKVLRQY